MACVVKARPCRLNFASLAGLECPLSNLSHGSATPGGRSARRTCEKRASPEPCQRFEENNSPNFVSPAADVVLAMQKEKRQQQRQQQYDLELQRQTGACAKRMRRSRKRLSVRFSCCSKSHDGLRSPSRLLDFLVFAYFETHRISCPNDIEKLISRQFGQGTRFSETVLEEVLAQMKELCDRCSRLGDNGSMPVLIQGGGRGSQLQSVHHPHLCRLTHFFEKFKENFLDQSIVDR